VPAETPTADDDASLAPSTDTESSPEVTPMPTEASSGSSYEVTPTSSEALNAEEAVMVETNEMSVVEEATPASGNSVPEQEDPSTPLPVFKMTTFDDDDDFHEEVINADDLFESDDDGEDRDSEEAPPNPGPDDAQAQPKAKRYCGGLPEGSVILDYINSVRKKLGDKTSSLSKQLTQGEYWIIPPDPVYAVKSAKKNFTQPILHAACICVPAGPGIQSYNCL